MLVSEEFAEETVYKKKKKKIVLWHLEAETFNTASNNIMLLLPRTVTCHIFHNMVVHANSFLEKELKTIQNIKYWNIKGVKNSPVNLYLDGVHFNQEGHITVLQKCSWSHNSSNNLSHIKCKF